MIEFLFVLVRKILIENDLWRQKVLSRFSNSMKFIKVNLRQIFKIKIEVVFIFHFNKDLAMVNRTNFKAFIIYLLQNCYQFWNNVWCKNGWVWMTPHVVFIKVSKWNSFNLTWEVIKNNFILICSRIHIDRRHQPKEFLLLR